MSSFDRALKLFPEDEIIKRSMSYEYKGDIERKNLEYETAIENYKKTIQFQEEVEKRLKEKKGQIMALNDKINDLKLSLIILTGQFILM